MSEIYSMTSNEAFFVRFKVPLEITTLSRAAYI